MLRGGHQLFVMHLSTEVLAILIYVSNTLQEESFLEKLEDYVKVQLPSSNITATSTTSKNRHHKTNPSLVASRWGIGL